jgi:hypothetical protein
MYRDRDAERVTSPIGAGCRARSACRMRPERQGEIRAPEISPEEREDRSAARGSSAAPERGMFAASRRGRSSARPRAEQTPRRGMFDGLKLSADAGDAFAPARADRGEDRAFARAVERASRSAEAVLQARASGGPVLEHQKVALERATEALDQIRPGASRDMASAIQRDPGLLRDAAAGRSGPMIEAMAQRRACAPILLCAPIGSWNAGRASARIATASIAPATCRAARRRARKWRAWRKALSAIAPARPAGGIDPARAVRRGYGRRPRAGASRSA